MMDRKKVVKRISITFFLCLVSTVLFYGIKYWYSESEREEFIERQAELQRLNEPCGPWTREKLRREGYTGCRKIYVPHDSTTSYFHTGEGIEVEFLTNPQRKDVRFQLKDDMTGTWYPLPANPCKYSKKYGACVIENPTYRFRSFTGRGENVWIISRQGTKEL